MGTRRVTASQFTVIWMVLGTLLNVVLLGIMPAYHGLLWLLGIPSFVPPQTDTLMVSFDPALEFLPFKTVVSATVLAAIGLGLLFVSSRLDFVDAADDPAKNSAIIAFLTFFFGISWLCFIGIELERAGYASGNGFYKFLLSAPMILLIIPAFFVNFLFVFGCTSLFLAGLITTPRTAMAYSRRHHLTHAWSQGIRGSRFDPAAVIGSLGDRTNSGAEGRKLRKDADRLRDEVQAHVVRLRGVRDKLRAGVFDNTEAKAMRREADEILAKVAALRAGKQRDSASGRVE